MPTEPSTSWDDVVRELRHGGPDGPAVAPPEPRRARHRRATAEPPNRQSRRRGCLPAIAVVLLVALAVVALTQREERGSAATAAPAEPVVTSAPLPTTWYEVLAELDAARAHAWTTARRADLAAVDVEGSPAERADRAVLAQLRRAEVRPEGLRTEVESVAVLRKSARRVELRVADRRSAYSLRAADGRVRQRVPSSELRVWRVVLVLSDERWLTERVAAA